MGLLRHRHSSRLPLGTYNKELTWLQIIYSETCKLERKIRQMQFLKEHIDKKNLEKLMINRPVAKENTALKKDLQKQRRRTREGDLIGPMCEWN